MTAEARAETGAFPGRSALEVGQGEMAVSADRAVEMTATLGSCVSVCLFASRAACGGMNHIYRNVGHGTMGRDAVVAEVECLVNALMRMGVARSEMSARLTGGAQVLLRGRNHGLAIADACMTYLAHEGFPIVGVSIGGRRARRVRFHPASGKLVVGLMAVIRPGDEPEPFGSGNAPEMF